MNFSFPHFGTISEGLTLPEHSRENMAHFPLGVATVHPVLVDVLLATLPALILAAVTWRLVWPRWKLLGKLLLHPVLYFALALLVGHWSVPVAWLHQGIGLLGHVRFSQKHGFTWYAVEDPARYVALSRASLDEWAQRLGKKG